jgi:hypothetical protein
VTLKWTNAQEMPQITMRSFDEGTTASGADEKDLQALYEAVQFSRRAFDDLVPLDGSFSETWPGANVSAESDVKQFIKDEAWGHHASCTCPIERLCYDSSKLSLDLVSRPRVKCTVFDSPAFALVAFSAFQYHFALGEMQYSWGQQTFGVRPSADQERRV